MGLREVVLEGLRDLCSAEKRAGKGSPYTGKAAR